MAGTIAETMARFYIDQYEQLGMLMFVVSNIVGSTIQITTLPLPVLSTLQAVCPVMIAQARSHELTTYSLVLCSIPYAPP